MASAAASTTTTSAAALVATATTTTTPSSASATSASSVSVFSSSTSPPPAPASSSSSSSTSGVMSTTTSMMVTPTQRVTEELLAYLERRGFQEANASAMIRSRPLPLGEFVHQRAVDCERGTGQPVKLGAPLIAPCRVEQEFVDFKNFISEAVEPFRSELSHCLWPVFVNALIDLLAAEQRHLLQRFEGMFGGLFAGVDLYSGLVEDLQGISNPQQLQQCTVLKEFRENKALVKLSADSWLYLQRFLRQSEYILHIFNVHIDVSIQLDSVSQHRLRPVGLEPAPAEPPEPHLFQTRHVLAQRYHQHLATLNGRTTAAAAGAAAGKAHHPPTHARTTHRPSGLARHKSPSAKRARINGVVVAPPPTASSGSGVIGTSASASSTYDAHTRGASAAAAANGASTLSPEPPSASALNLLRQSIDKVRSDVSAPSVLLIDVNASTLSSSVASLALSEETFAVGLDNGTIALQRRRPRLADDTEDSDQEGDDGEERLFSSRSSSYASRASWRRSSGQELHSSTVRLHPSATRSLSPANTGRPPGGRANPDDPDDLLRDPSDNDARRMRLLGHGSAVSALAYSSPSLLLSASSDTSVRAWDASTGRNMALYTGHQYPVWCLATSPEGLYFATGSQDATARLWTPSRTHALRVMAGHLGQLDALAFHPNANYLATAASDRSIRLWAVQSGAVVRLFPATHRGQAHTLAFSPNGHWLAVAGEDRAVRLWDLRACRLLADMQGHHDAVTSIVFSKDGSLLLSSSLDGSVRMWNVHTMSAGGIGGGVGSTSSSCSSSGSSSSSTNATSFGGSSTNNNASNNNNNNSGSNNNNNTTTTTNNNGLLSASSGGTDSTPVHNGDLVCCLRFQPRVPGSVQGLGCNLAGVRKLELHQRLNIVTAVRVYSN